MFHGFVHGVKAGQLYGYYVRGPFDPARGFRFNEHKLLIDPYARAVSGKPKNNDNLLLGYDTQSHWRDMSIDTRDSAPVVPKGQRAKNLMCQLIFSAGTPMLLGGDEMLRTQRGNNNAYCRDDELSWFDWRLVEKNRDFFEFTKHAIAFAKRYPVLQRRTFFSGRDSNLDERPDIRWYGNDLGQPWWSDPELRTVAYQLDGAEADNGAGDYLVFVILNADWRQQSVRLPEPGSTRKWHRVVDTALPAGKDFLPDGKEAPLDPADAYIIEPRSTVVLLAREAR